MSKCCRCGIEYPLVEWHYVDEDKNNLYCEACFIEYLKTDITIAYKLLQDITVAWRGSTLSEMIELMRQARVLAGDE